MPRRITIHEEDYGRLLEMKKEDAGLILQNLIRTLNGEPVEIKGDAYVDYFSEVTCQKMMRFVELSERQAEKGRKGGAPIGNTNRKQPKNNPKTTQKQPKTNPYTYTNTYTNTNKDKKTYGECANVYLTDEEHSKIVNDGLTGLIDELSFYIASKGDKYKSHYAVIKQWAMRRKREQAEKEKPKSNQFTQGVMSRDIDFTDLEKKLIKN